MYIYIHIHTYSIHVHAHVLYAMNFHTFPKCLQGVGHHPANRMKNQWPQPGLVNQHLYSDLMGSSWVMGRAVSQQDPGVNSWTWLIPTVLTFAGATTVRCRWAAHAKGCGAVALFVKSKLLNSVSRAPHSLAHVLRAGEGRKHAFYHLQGRRGCGLLTEH